MGRGIEAIDCHCYRERSIHLLFLGGRRRLHLWSWPHLEHFQKRIAAIVGLFPYLSIPTEGSDGAGLGASETLQVPCHLL